MLRSDALEAAGDAAGTLRLIESMPNDANGRSFWRPERVRRLRQLVELGVEAPAWVWARWIVSQAAQSTISNPQRAMDLAIETRGGPSTLWGVDPTDARCKVIDHDWVYRQLVVHDHGGLEAFLRRRAGRELLAHADGVAAWVGVPMGAYELLIEGTSQVTWRDLGSGKLVDTLNLAGAAMCSIGEHVIGRLVRSGDVRLFESAPLYVPPDVAARVADSPSDWVGAVADGCRGPLGPALSAFVAKMHHFDLMCDLPCQLRRQLIQPGDPGLRADRVGSGGNGEEYDAALVLAALAGELDVEGEGTCSCGECGDGRPTAPLVAAALLEPGTSQALGELLLPADAIGLRWLGGVLAPPAGIICERLAGQVSDAA